MNFETLRANKVVTEPTKEVKEESEKEKLKLEGLVDSLKNLAIILKKREVEALTPLADPEVIPRLMSGANELESGTTSKIISFEDLNQSLKKIFEAIKTIGEVRSQTGLKDNPESLKMVGFRLRNMTEACKTLRLKIGSTEDNNAKETLNLLHLLEESTINKWGFIMKKSKLLQDYLGGR